MWSRHSIISDRSFEKERSHFKNQDTVETMMLLYMKGRGLGEVFSRSLCRLSCRNCLV